MHVQVKVKQNTQILKRVKCKLYSRIYNLLELSWNYKSESQTGLKVLLFNVIGAF